MGPGAQPPRMTVPTMTPVSVGELVRSAVKVVAGAADVVRPRRGVVVLLYHRVAGGTSSRVDLSLSLFERQVAHIAASGRASTLDAALDVLVSGSAPPPVADPVVVTFDDGTADFVDVAVPVLSRHAVPACVYVATSFVDSGTPFPWGAKPVSWAGLRDVVSTGLVTVGSHTHTHLLLDRVAPSVAADELDRSIDLIGTHVGAAPAHFAYPKAIAGSRAEVAARFRSAAVAGCRPNRYGHTDPYALARSPIQETDGMRWFRRKFEGGMATEDDLRRVLNRRRYADAVR